MVPGLWTAPTLAPCSSDTLRKPAGLESLTLTFYQDHIEHRVIAGIMQQILASHRSRWKSKRSATISGMKERSRAISGLTAPTLRCRWIFAIRAPVRGAAAPTLYSDRLASRRRPLAQWRNELGELVPATGRQQSNGAAYPPLADYSGTTQYARPAYEHPRLVRF